MNAKLTPIRLGRVVLLALNFFLTHALMFDGFVSILLGVERQENSCILLGWSIISHPNL